MAISTEDNFEQYIIKLIVFAVVVFIPVKPLTSTIASLDSLSNLPKRLGSVLTVILTFVKVQTSYACSLTMFLFHNILE